MSRKTMYWTIGIAVAVLVIIAFILLSRGMNGSENSSSIDHGEMEHSTSSSMAPTDNPNLEAYLKEQDAIMSQMMAAMGGVEKSGNASIDFLQGMIPHHESAVEMAQSYLQYGGENPSLKAIAEDIIKVQNKEIEQMRQMIETLKTAGGTDTQKEEAYLKAYNDMMSQHHMGHSTAQGVEQAFADGMIEHHRMAVDMAKAILENTDDPQVKTFAQNVIDTQEKEIAEMQQILGTLVNA